MSVINIPGAPLRLVKPAEGGPTEPLPGGDALVGVDGNAYAIMAHVERLLKRAGASETYREAYLEDAKAGDYDWLLSTSIAYLTDEAG